MRFASSLFVVAALASAGRSNAAPASIARQEPHELHPGGGDAEAEMRRLFGAVERDLRRIDKLLDEARAARLPAAAERAKLLATTKERGEAVLEGIDKILELAAQNSSSSGGGGGGASSNPGRSSSGSSGQQTSPQGEGQTSPLDRGGQESTGREATPSAPEKDGTEPGGSKPGEDGQSDGQGKPKPKPGGEKNQGRGEQGQGRGKDPRDGNQPSGTDGKNELSGDPSKRATGAGANTDGARDRWGDLPEHAREVFRMQGGGDLPPRYREWIDAYYKRLNKKP